MNLEEQETTINFCRTEKGFNVWTSDRTVMTKLDKLCNSSPMNYKLVNVGKIDGQIADKEYIVTDKKLLSFRAGKRALSDEQKAKLAERAKETFSR